MANNGTLTTKQRRAVAALLQARTVEEAANLARVGERTLWRWIRENDEFAQALHLAESQAISAAVRVLIGDLSANHATMRLARDAPGGKTADRLRAAQALDNSALRWLELQALTDRVTQLEIALYARKKG